MVPSYISAAMPSDLGQGRVGVDGEADVGGVRPHLDREPGLGHELAGIRADDAAAQQAVGRLVEQELGHALVAAQRQRAARGRPGEDALAVLDALGLGLVLGQARPRRPRGRCRRPRGSPRHRRRSSCRWPPRPRPCPRAPPCAPASAGRPRRRWRRCAARWCACCLSTGMKPRSSTMTPAFSAAIALPLGRRPTATRMRSNVSVAGARAALEADHQPLGPGLDLGDLGFQEDVLVLLADPLVERGHDVLVGPRDDLVHQLDDGHLGPELVVDRGHLQPDDPAADHQQPLGHAAQFQRTGGIDHPRVVVRDERHGHHLGAGGDDRLLEADRLLAARRPGSTSSWLSEVNRPVP